MLSLSQTGKADDGRNRAWLWAASYYCMCDESFPSHPSSWRPLRSRKDCCQWHCLVASQRHWMGVQSKIISKMAEWGSGPQIIPCNETISSRGDCHDIASLHSTGPMTSPAKDISCQLPIIFCELSTGNCTKTTKLISCWPWSSTEMLTAVTIYTAGADLNLWSVNEKIHITLPNSGPFDLARAWKWY